MANNGPTYRVDDGTGKDQLLKLTAKEGDEYIATHPGAHYVKNPRALTDADELPPVAGMPSLDEVEGDAVDAAAQARALGDLVRVDDGAGNLTKLRQGEVAGYIALHPGAHIDGRPPAARMLGTDREPEDLDPDDVRKRLLAQSRPQLNAIAAGLGIDGAGMANKIEVTDAIMAARDAGPDEDERVDDDDEDVLEDLDDAALAELAEANEISAESRDDAIAQLREKGVKRPPAAAEGQDGQNGGNGSA